MRIALILALGLAFPGAAQDPAPKPDAAKAPAFADMMQKPGPEMARLKAFQGTWEVEEIHEPGPLGPGGKGQGVGRVVPGPGGLSMIIDYHSAAGPMRGFRGHGVLAWDEPSRSYRQSWVDNVMAMLMVSRGAWAGDTFVMHAEGTMMGKPFKSRDTFSGITKEGFTLTSEMSLDGAPMTKVMTLVHRRMKSGMRPADPKAGDLK
jgi:hypothetical protein